MRLEFTVYIAAQQSKLKLLQFAYQDRKKYVVGKDWAMDKKLPVRRCFSLLVIVSYWKFTDGQTNSESNFSQ